MPGVIGMGSTVARVRRGTGAVPHGGMVHRAVAHGGMVYRTMTHGGVVHATVSHGALIGRGVLTRAMTRRGVVFGRVWSMPVGLRLRLWLCRWTGRLMAVMALVTCVF